MEIPEEFKDLPCIEISCLKLPICRHKESIPCQHLLMWIDRKKPTIVKFEKLFSNLKRVIASGESPDNRIRFAYQIHEDANEIDGKWYVIHI